MRKLGIILGLLGSLWIMASAAAGKRDPFPEPKKPFHALVEQGQPRAIIVVEPEAPKLIDFAADELRDYLQRISGAELTIAEQAPADRLPIYIGGAARRRMSSGSWDSLGKEGFRIRSNSNAVYIAGNKPLGTLFGVYDFLEQQLGVRWFRPGELGTVVPKNQTVKIGTTEYRETPDFKYRWVSQGDWARRQKMNATLRIDGRTAGYQWKWGFHTHFKFIPPDEYYDQHPEWFALVGGERRRPHQLCLSNEQMIEEMAGNVIKFLDENPDVDILSLAPQDGNGFCECDDCRALDDAAQRPEYQRWHAQYSSRLAWFNNQVARRVAKKHPDKLLKVGAYAMYLRVPLDPDYRPESNLAVQVAHTYSCNNHPIQSQDCWGNTHYFRNELEQWARITDHLFIYEYYKKGVLGNLPYDQIHVIRHDIPYYKQQGVQGFYTQKPRDRWASTQPNHYVAAKMLWNSDVDVDALLSDFYQKYYQQAAKPMRAYYEAVRDAYTGYDDCISPFGYQWTTAIATDLFRPKILQRMDSALDRAERKAKSEIVQRRITETRGVAGFARRVVDYLKAIREPFEGVDRNDAAAFAKARKEAKKIGEPLSNQIRDYAKQHRINVSDRLIEDHRGGLRFLQAGKSRPLRFPPQ